MLTFYIFTVKNITDKDWICKSALDPIFFLLRDQVYNELISDMIKLDYFIPINFFQSAIKSELKQSAAFWKSWSVRNQGFIPQHLM